MKALQLAGRLIYDGDLTGRTVSTRSTTYPNAGSGHMKGVFKMHHLKVRPAPGLYLQEQFAVFGANFVPWAAHWLAAQCP
jgi:hypothetical protein